MPVLSPGMCAFPSTPSYFCAMIRIYGIKNCDIMVKAMRWLDANHIPYEFHNYRDQGIDKATIEGWLKHLPLGKILNQRSTTFRELPESDRAAASDQNAAIALMMEHTSVIKRPLWDFGNGHFFAGWDEKEVTRLK